MFLQKGIKCRRRFDLPDVGLAASYLPLGAGNFALGLVVAVVMAVALAVFLMDLRNATTLVRIVAMAGLFRRIFMFALTFSDYLSRS
ncbi:hypothetical protein JQ615_18615 [Bradyrhizobium jicamae]|uniref:Uncharacterized protein n=1 Tax=Bradyrhizobium jicamae TaxID=280332 RepID=A0ABS5FKU5_9BRAD|nr:hypothetical protein [Bradyrhizobium jicamae]MBR0797404.1 hypothetical protein [Bradyrhizobium jicamae]